MQWLSCLKCRTGGITQRTQTCSEYECLAVAGVCKRLCFDINVCRNAQNFSGLTPSVEADMVMFSSTMRRADRTDAMRSGVKCQDLQPETVAALLVPLSMVRPSRRSESCLWITELVVASVENSLMHSASLGFLVRQAVPKGCVSRWE